MRRSSRTSTAGPRADHGLLSTPAREVWRAAAPYRGRYAAGLLCLAAATTLSLLIPWTVKHAIDALAADAAAAPLGHYVGFIVLCAAGNGVARLASRYAIAAPPSTWRRPAGPPLRRAADFSAGGLRALHHRRPHGPRHQRRQRGTLAARLRRHLERRRRRWPSSARWPPWWRWIRG